MITTGTDSGFPIKCEKFSNCWYRVHLKIPKLLVALFLKGESHMLYDFVSGYSKEISWALCKQSTENLQAYSWNVLRNLHEKHYDFEFNAKEERGSCLMIDSKLTTLKWYPPNISLFSLSRPKAYIIATCVSLGAFSKTFPVLRSTGVNFFSSPTCHQQVHVVQNTYCYFKCELSNHRVGSCKPSCACTNAQGNCLVEGPQMVLRFEVIIVSVKRALTVDEILQHNRKSSNASFCKCDELSYNWKRSTPATWVTQNGYERSNALISITPAGRISIDGKLLKNSL